MGKTSRKLLFFTLKLLVSGTLLYIVLRKAGAEDVLSLLARIHPLLFMAAVLLYVLALFIGSVRWQMLLPDRFPLRRLFPLYLLGSFFSTFLPGLVGGDAVKIYYLYKETGKGSLALSSVFMDRYVGFTSLMLLGLAAYPLGFKYIRGSWIEWLLPLMVILFVLGSLVVFGLRLGKSIGIVGKLHEYFHEYRRKYGVIGKALLLSFALQLLSVLGIYLLAIGLGVRIPFTSLLLFVPIITVVAAIPVSLSGIGLREASAVLLLGTVGVEPDSATAISLAWFLMAATGRLTGFYEYLRVKER
jgi:uncharacterized membrane protein YbhN (UPF0104 family)